MSRSGALRVLFLSVMLIALGLSTELVFAGVHGGGGGFHGGGGGFHGGGGGGGFHGGGAYSGYRGGYGGYHGGYHGGYGGYRGGYSGYHGGYGGYRGGYGYAGWRGGYGWGGGWGYPGYCCGWGGWGWGFGISFNFAPSWGYNGYPYGYSAPYYPYYPYYPSYTYPYYYAPVSGSPGYSDPAPYSQSGGNLPEEAPATQPGAAVPHFAAPSNSVTLRNAVYRPPAANSANASTGRAVSYRPPAAEPEPPPMRPEVQNVIRALRAMPPEARQQQMESGQYGNLTTQELKLVKSAADVPWSSRMP